MAACSGGELAIAGDQVCRAVQIIDANTGQAVLGIEDIAVDRANGVAYLSAYDRRAAEYAARASADVVPVGAIYRLGIDQLADDGIISVGRAMDSDTLGRQFRPHGVDIVPPSDGGGLVVINRTYTRSKPGAAWRLAPEILKFEINADALHVSATSAAPCQANGVAALANNQYLITKDHGACDWRRAFEDIFSLRRGQVILAAGGRYQTVAAKRFFPNGIALNLADDIAVIAATRSNALEVYSLNTLRAGQANSPDTVIKLSAAPDNLNWAGDGRLLVAGLPDLMRSGFHRNGWFGVKRAPSRIMAVDIESGTSEILFDDPTGHMISSASVAAELGDALLIGSALDDGLVICRREKEEGP